MLLSTPISNQAPVRLLLALTALTLSACAGVRVNDYAGAASMRPEEYFLGTTYASGLVQDRSGKVVSQFNVTMLGHFEGEVFVLDEDFVYANGDRQHRQWRITPQGDGHYTATAGDVIGTAQAQASGLAFNMDYVLALPIDGRTWHIDVDDWIYRQPDGTAINHAIMRKFGLRVGEIVLYFRKPDDAPQDIGAQS